MTEYDLVVIGAGPAGMAAAVEADRAGASVLVIDEQPRPGGQIFRDVTETGEALANILGDDYLAGRKLTDQFSESGCQYAPGSTVWKVSANAEVVHSSNQQSTRSRGNQVLIATGALERPMPIPGWTLPQVLTAGAAQILLKSRGIVVHDAVLVGCGPLLYLLAAQLIRSGSKPRALVETQTHAQYKAAVRHLPRALAGWRTLMKGGALLGTIRRAGVPRYCGATDIEILGAEQASSIKFTHNGQAVNIECDKVLLHQGVVPNTQISRSLNLDHHWHSVQRCFTPTVDEWGVSSNPLIAIAGDGAGINGADSAALRGRRAALGFLAAQGFMSLESRDQQAEKINRYLKKELAARPFLDVLYAPMEVGVLPADDTVVCRCENVTAGDIRRYAAVGCVGPNQTKAFGRSGMGPCQGRYCGISVTEILAATNGLTPAETGSYRIRSPIKPVTLGELASLHDGVDK